MMNSPRTDFRVSGEACVIGAVALLVLPLRWILAVGTAAAVHELCHLAALYLCGVKVHEIRLGSCGAVIETEPVSPGRELICALAGPVGSLALLAFPIFPVLSVAGLAQGCFNLLPIYPMDGGRALRCLLCLTCPKQTDRVVSVVERAAVMLLAGGGFWIAWRLRWGFGAVLVTLFVIQRAVAIKIPCKAARKRVQ